MLSMRTYGFFVYALKYIAFLMWLKRLIKILEQWKVKCDLCSMRRRLDALSVNCVCAKAEAIEKGVNRVMFVIEQTRLERGDRSAPTMRCRLKNTLL